MSILPVLKRLAQQLEKNGTPVGLEKDEVVNIISCPGTERCKYANIDTIHLAKRIDGKLFGKEMPDKIRIAPLRVPERLHEPHAERDRRYREDLSDPYSRPGAPAAVSASTTVRRMP